ncbi:DHA2 family efflux MFS transporter permease subunit [Chloroflexota bacterium]
MGKAERSISYKWAAVSVVAVGAFISTLDVGVIRIALPHLGHVFQAAPDTVVWVWLIKFFIGTSLMLTLGRAGDAFGRKKLFILGLLISSLGLGLCSLAQGLLQLVIFRLVQAIGDAMTIAIGNAIITTSFPSEERGKVLGIIVAVAGVGALSGPALGGFLLDLFGWRSIFYARLPFGIAGVTMAWALLKEQSSPRREEKFDLSGAVALFFTLTCLLLAVNRGQSLGWTSPWVAGLGAMSMLSLFFFLAVEQRAAQPVLDLRLFRSRLFSIASASHVFLYMSSAAISFLTPFYLIQGLRFSASKAGLLLVTIPAISVVLSLVSGRLSDKKGTRFLCSSGLMLIALGMLLLGNLGTDTAIGNVVLCLIIVGVGLGLFDSPNTSAIMGAVPRERLGTASALVGTLRQAGMSFGLAITGTIFTTRQIFHATQLTSQGLTEDMLQKISTVNGFHDTILAMLATALIGLVISVLRGRR